MIENDIVMYGEEGKNYAQHGDIQKAQLMLTKKKLAEKEVFIVFPMMPGRNVIKLFSCSTEMSMKFLPAHKC